MKDTRSRLHRLAAVIISSLFFGTLIGVCLLAVCYGFVLFMTSTFP